MKITEGGVAIFKIHHNLTSSKLCIQATDDNLAPADSDSCGGDMKEQALVGHCNS